MTAVTTPDLELSKVRALLEYMVTNQEAVDFDMASFESTIDQFRSSPESQPSLTYYANKVTQESECNEEKRSGPRLGTFRHPSLDCDLPMAYVWHDHRWLDHRPDFTRFSEMLAKC